MKSSNLIRDVEVLVVVGDGAVSGLWCVVIFSSFCSFIRLCVCGFFSS